MTHTWVTYNAGHASDARLYADLLEIIDGASIQAIEPQDNSERDSPLVVGLEEVGDRAKVLSRFKAWTRGEKAATPAEHLRRVANDSGYRFVQLDDGPSSTHLAALVSPTVDLGKPWLKALTPRTKVGRRTAGARRTGYAEAKYLLAVPYKIDGHKHVFGVVHFVPSAMKRGNTATRDLHGRQVESAARWLRRRKRTAILAGDMNAATNKPRERKLLEALAKVAPLRSVPSRGKRAIDVFATELRGTVSVVPGEFSSDHRPLRFIQE